MDEKNAVKPSGSSSSRFREMKSSKCSANGWTRRMAMISLDSTRLAFLDVDDESLALMREHLATDGL